MLALLIEDGTLIKQRQITVAVRFRGGATTTLTLPRPLTAQQLRATHPAVRDHIDTLLDEYTDAQVAHLLNECGAITGARTTFDADSVRWVGYAPRVASRLASATTKASGPTPYPNYKSRPLPP